MFTDTDSLMQEIKIDNVYEDFSKDKKMFNFRKYSPRSYYHDDSNKLVAGKRNMKQVVLLLNFFFDSIQKCIYSW